jgi:glucoamylase
LGVKRLPNRDRRIRMERARIRNAAVQETEHVPRKGSAADRDVIPIRFGSDRATSPAPDMTNALMTGFEDGAPGAPGIDARWTSSAKNGVGTALSTKSPVWFTLSHGILNEVYFPRVDSACTRDFGLVVTGADGYFSEEKRACRTETSALEGGIPAFWIVNSAGDGRYRTEKAIITDPDRPCVLQRVTFTALQGAPGDYRVHALLSPHLVNAGMQNSAWIGEFRGVQILFATGRSRYLALASSLPWRAASAGFVGVSDGWQQLRWNGRIEPQYHRADNGNVALVGEIGFTDAEPTADLALAFGQTEYEAAARALDSLDAGFQRAWDGYVDSWRRWQDSLRPLDRGRERSDPYRISTAVLASHRAVDRPGAVVASLSVPWGFSKGDDDLGGYHLVWPRDLVETAGGFLAAGDADEALAILEYLREVQEPSGRWPQNLWLDGRPYWPGVQMDECAFPILLADLLHRNGHLPKAALARFLPMLRSAAGYILMNGPVTAEDRWEEDAGYSPFTLAVEIAALLAAADLLETDGDARAATHLRETADCWNEQVEKWTFDGDAHLCRRAGVSGYYVRISAPAATDVSNATDGSTPILNQVPENSHLPAGSVISPDALALVRFGLRAPDDPRIVETVKAIDHALIAELPQGPLWYRYTGDGYGEHEDGAPFDGIGKGRPWPLLAGERAHYELAAGRREAAEALLATLEASAGDGGLFPEQTWDGPDLPERELFRGRPSGSAMPLVWAHSEHLKLLRSLKDGAVFDLPPQGVKRYIDDGTGSALRIWRFNNKLSVIPAGKGLRIELGARAVIHWSRDGWSSAKDTWTEPTAFGSHFADLPVKDMAPGESVVFTFHWPEAGTWENADFTVRIADS